MTDPPRPPRARDPLLAAVCHDLRAPLAAVTMGANFVLQTTPEDEASGRSRRVLQAILRSCSQMERLVRDFSDLSQIEADALVLRPGIHDAVPIVAMAHEAHKTAAEGRGVALVLAPSVDAALLRCDRDRILRALDHLLENAIRHSSSGGTVTLAVTCEGSEIRIAVHDAGPGLSEETRQHLYDRAWHGRRADRVGAGLGLAIALGLIRAHDGRIEVASAPGDTTFTLVLPRDTPSLPDLSAAAVAR